MSGYLVLDLETVPADGWQPKDPEVPGEFPGTIYHRIVSFGSWYFNEQFEPVRLGNFSDRRDEREAVAAFVAWHARMKPAIVTWNGRGFDLPVIAHRCLEYGIPFPAYYHGERGRDCRYRYHQGGSFDLMDYLSDHGATKATALKRVVELLGIRHGAVTGADVRALWEADRRAEVRAYCVQDVAMTALVWLRVELLRGTFDLETFQRAGALALDAIRSTAETKRMVIDQGRYLLK